MYMNVSSHVYIYSCVFSTFYQHTKHMHRFDLPCTSAKLQELSALLSEFHFHNESVTPISASLDVSVNEVRKGAVLIDVCWKCIICICNWLYITAR